MWGTEKDGPGRTKCEKSLSLSQGDFMGQQVTQVWCLGESLRNTMPRKPGRSIRHLMAEHIHILLARGRASSMLLPKDRSATVYRVTAVMSGLTLRAHHPVPPLQYWPILLGAVCPPCTVATSPSLRPCFLQRTQQNHLFSLAATPKPPPGVLSISFSSRPMSTAPFPPLLPHQPLHSSFKHPGSALPQDLCTCLSFHLGHPSLPLFPLVLLDLQVSAQHRLLRDAPTSQLKHPTPALLSSAALTTIRQNCSLPSCPSPQPAWGGGAQHLGPHSCVPSGCSLLFVA